MEGKRFIHFALAALVLMLGAGLAFAAKPDPADAFFDAKQFHILRIRISAENWQTMQPGWRGNDDVVRGRLIKHLGGLEDQTASPSASGHSQTTRPATPPVPAPVRDKDSGHLFVPAKVELAGKTLADVGIRFKGNSSYYIDKRTLHRPLKIDFNRYDDDARFAGLKQLNLANNALDPSQLRESIAYWVYAQAAVPASRTALVLVYLNVEGQAEKCIGLYTAVEEVNKDFLKQRFGHKDGLLFKPSGAEDLPYEGEGFSSYRGYQPKTPANERTGPRLAALTRLIHRSDDPTFAREIAGVLDVPEFLRFLAATVVIADLDSVLATGHNFYIYVDPADLKIRFLPWDKNLSAGGYLRMGSGEELADLSILKPYEGRNRLIQRLLAVPEFNQQYLSIMRDQSKKLFADGRMASQVKAMGEVVSSAMGLAGADCPKSAMLPAWPAPMELGMFYVERAKSIEAQLAGAEGYRPRYRTDSIGGLVGYRPTRPAQPLFTPDLFKALDEDHNGAISRAEIEKGASIWWAMARPTMNTTSVDKAQVSEALKKLLPEPAGKDGATPEPPRRRARRSEYGLEDRILFQADRNLDGKLVWEEVRRTAMRLFAEGDEDGDGSLNQTELGATVGNLFSGRWRE